MRNERILSALPPEEPGRMLRNGRRRCVTAPATLLNSTKLRNGRKLTELNQVQEDLSTAPTKAKKTKMGSNSVMVRIDLALLDHKPSPQGTDVTSCTWSKRKGRRKLSGKDGEGAKQQKRCRKSDAKEDTVSLSEELCKADIDGATINPAEIRSASTPSKPTSEVKTTSKKTSRTTFDQNVEKDACDSSSESSSDSDDELPSMFAADSGSINIKKGDLAWVRIHKFPFWPCVVKLVYYKKKQLRKVSVVFIGDPILQQTTTGSGFCLNYKKQNVVPFGGESEQHKKFKEEGLASEFKSCFSEAVARAEDFVWKRCLGDVKEDGLKFFGDDEVDFEDVDDVEESSMPDKADTLERGSALSSVDDDSSEEAPMPVEETEMEESVSASVQRSLQKRVERNESLIQFIKTDDKMKKFLESIYSGKRKCARHDLHHKENQSKAERAELRKHSFGPIDDEDQQEEILHALIDWLKEIQSETITDISYVLDVWVPEAIIFALINVKKYNRKRAADLFDKGITRTKKKKVPTATLR